MKAFPDNPTFRSSFFNCPSQKKQIRMRHYISQPPSINKIMPRNDEGKEVNLVLINSKKTNQVFKPLTEIKEAISDNVIYYINVRNQRGNACTFQVLPPETKAFKHYTLTYLSFTIYNIYR